jgi:hypothetical protein
MRRFIVASTFFALLLVGVNSAMAGGYPWKEHAAPFDFRFGNHIDQFQQSKLLGNGDLQGFFYIMFTGGSVQGAPAAAHGEDSVGWILYGVPMKAKLKALPDMQSMQMPLWCINASDLPREKGFSHFHWLGMPMMGDGLTVGQIYEGFLLKLTAIDTFFFSMGMGGDMSGGILVTPGIDDYSHYNIVTDCN